MKILIVDDEKAIRRALYFALHKKSHQVMEAGRPLDALEIIKKERFDLLILDYNMTLVSGFDIVKLIRNHGSRTPVVMLTSQEFFASDISSLKKSVNHIVSKDHSIKEIVRQIENMFQNP